MAQTTVGRCPTIEQLDKIPTEALDSMLHLAELAIAKPYLVDRLRLTLTLRAEGIK